MSGVEGLRRVGGVGPARRAERRGARDGAADVGAAADDRDRRAGVLRVARRSGALRAVEHHVRHHGAAGAAAEEQAGAQAGDRRSARWPTSTPGCRRESTLERESAVAARGSRRRQVTVTEHLEGVPRSFFASTATSRRTPSAPTRAICRSSSITPRHMPASAPRGSRRRGARSDGHPQLSSARCTREGQSRATAARKLAAVRTFLRYLRREDDHRRRSRGARRDAEARSADAGASVGGRDDARCSRRPPPTRRSAAAIARSSSCSTRRGCA